MPSTLTMEMVILRGTSMSTSCAKLDSTGACTLDRPDGPVKKGEQIAFSGKFGPCGNPSGDPAHLHFEVRKGPIALQDRGGVLDLVVDPYADALWVH